MPIYTFQNKETDEVIELSLSLKEREEYLNTHPYMKQIITSAPTLGDPVRLGLRHHDSEFNDLLKTIKKNNRGSNINTR